MPGPAADPAASRPLSPLAPEGVRAVLLDVEGTTSPVDFVYRTLFPFARERVGDFLAERWPQLSDEIAQLCAEHAAEAGAAPPAWVETPEAVATYVLWLMDQDRKSTGLKGLQGRIWEAGYRGGALRGEVYPDVPRAFERWGRRGLSLAIFSSGSVLAQRLIFRHSTAGDLTGPIEAYFDTTTGPKRAPESYRRIASALGLTPPAVLFLSDVIEELDAAGAAGVKTGLCLREGEPEAPQHPVLRSFDDVLP